jgi:hypothetical protein
MTKRRLETLTNEELAQVFGMRCRKLEAWLATNTWGANGRYVATKHVYFDRARRFSLRVMECLAEVEARAVPNSKWDVPYLAKALGGGKYE